MSVCSSFSPLSLGGGRDTKEAFFRPDEEGREGRGGAGHEYQDRQGDGFLK